MRCIKVRPSVPGTGVRLSVAGISAYLPFRAQPRRPA
jgi:hypothetical protein